MRNNSIARLAMAVALLGLIGVVFYSNSIKPVPYAPNTNQLNREVRLTGRVTRVGENKELVILDLVHPVTTPVLVYKPRQLRIRVNDTIVVTGVCNEYRGEKRLIAYRIEIIG